VADLGLLRILLDLLDRLLFGREFAFGDEVLKSFLLANEFLERHRAGIPVAPEFRKFRRHLLQFANCHRLPGT